MSVLADAWAHVRAKGLASKLPETREEICRFDAKLVPNLRRISDQLRHERFAFKPAKGVAKKRAGKSPRPIVMAPVANRIVQRAILDTLRTVPNLDPYFCVDGSYGEKGVRAAVLNAFGAITTLLETERSRRSEGRPARRAYFIRSDIRGFFTRIRREIPLRRIADATADEKFNGLLRDATRAELANAEALGDSIRFFPTDELGVPQGCSLSCFIGDVLLHEFDLEMSQRGILCLRYVDDFLLLGPSRQFVLRAFHRGQEILGKLELDAYDPDRDTDKASHGFIDDGLTFLGCEIYPGLVQPSKVSRASLLTEVDRILQESLGAMTPPHSVRQRRASFVEATNRVRLLTTGWGRHYAFCNSRRLFAALDEKIDHRLRRYGTAYRALSADLSPSDARRALGVPPLVDCLDEDRPDA
jgi:hypothetical protein